AHTTAPSHTLPPSLTTLFRSRRHHVARDVDAADQREFAQDPSLAGRGQRVLEVHRRKRGPDHDLTLGQFVQRELLDAAAIAGVVDRKSTRLNSSHVKISYAVL